MSAGKPSAPEGRRGPSEAEELARAVPSLGLPLPRYEGRSLVNVASTLLRAVGGEPSGDPPIAPPLDPSLDPFRGRPAEGPVVLLVVDGLGWYDLERWSLRSARSPAWRTAAHPITTVFPSTTTAALFSLATGTPPGRHGLLGYRQYLPRFGLVADMLKMSPLGVEARDLLVGPEWVPADLSGAPTIYRRGVRSAAVTRDRFEGTGFSRLLYDGARFVGYATATDLAHELARLLEGDPPPLITAYWDELDTIQHLKGPDPELIDLEIDRTLSLMGYVASRIGPAKARRATLLVTGDHGQVPAAPSGRLSVETVPGVAAELARPLSGDRRAGFFTARPGRIDALDQALRRHLPRGSTVLSMGSAIEAGLFGPPPYHPEMRERLGDLLALVPSPSSLTYRLPGMAAPKRFLYGAHGGLEPAELLVPLVAGPLEEFADGSPGRPTKR